MIDPKVAEQLNGTEAPAPRKRRTPQEVEDAKLAQEQAKLEKIRAAGRLRRRKEAHAHVEQAMALLGYLDCDADVSFDIPADRTSFDWSARELLVEIRSALRAEIPE